MMRFFEEMLLCPHRMGIACAIGAVLLGLAYMLIAGAPMGYLGINAGALVMGLVILVPLRRITTRIEQRSGAMTLILALALLATALFGNRVDGAARWVAVGALNVQPSLILLPVMIVSFARSRDTLSMVGMILAAIAIAIQPDRAMGGMLVAGLAVLTTLRRDRFSVSALVASLFGFVVTFIRADTLPAVPFVDRILYSSFEISFMAGLAVLAGAILLVVPGIAGAAHDLEHRHAYGVFGAVWLAAIAAAALGNYPTPVVGYSGGAVLGYVLSLTMLPNFAHSRCVAGQRAPSEKSNALSPNPPWRLGSAA